MSKNPALVALSFQIGTQLEVRFRRIGRGGFPPGGGKTQGVRRAGVYWADGDRWERKSNPVKWVRPPPPPDFESLRSAPPMCRVQGTAAEKMVPDWGTQSRRSLELEAGSTTGQGVFPAKLERARSQCLVVFILLAQLNAKQLTLVISSYSHSNSVK